LREGSTHLKNQQDVDFMVLVWQTAATYLARMTRRKNACAASNQSGDAGSDA
jgi:hypothetical protein